MQDLLSRVIREEHYNSGIFKKVIEEGTTQLPLRSILTLNRTIYNEEHKCVQSTNTIRFRLVDYGDSTPTAFHIKFRSMKLGEKALIWFEMGEHDLNEYAWVPL